MLHFIRSAAATLFALLSSLRLPAARQKQMTNFFRRIEWNNTGWFQRRRLRPRPQMLIRAICTGLCLTLVFSSLPYGVSRASARNSQTPVAGQGAPAVTRQLPPYENLPDITELVTEGKNLNRPEIPLPPHKPSTMCGYRDAVCKKIKEKEKKKIGQNVRPVSSDTAQMSVSTEPKRGGWFSRLRRKVADSLSFSGTGSSSFNRGNSFLSGSTTKTVAPGLPAAAPPPPPTFTSMNQARLDPRYRVGGASEDLFSGNHHWSLPLVSLPGRNGHDLTLSLHYNSLVWLKYNNTMHFDYDFFDSQNYSTLTPGFRLGLPVIESAYSVDGYNTYIVILPSGARVNMRQVGGDPNLYEAIDSSYLYLSFNTTNQTATLYTTDGTQYQYSIPNGDWWYRCTQVKDSNGNFITINYGTLGDPVDQVFAVSSITDTLGRVLNFTYDSYLHLASITQNWQGQTFTYAQFNYTNLTIQHNFGGLSVFGPNNGSTIPVMNYLVTGDGARHLFVYNSWGQIWAILKYGEVNNLRTEIDYTFPNTSQPLSDCPRFSERRDYLANWAGANFTGWVSNYFSYDSNETWGQVITPDGVTHKELFSNSDGTRGLTTGMETWYGGQKKKWTTTTWTSDSTTSPPLRPRVIETNIYDDADGNGSYDNRRRTTISYTTIATTVKLPSIVKEYNADATTVYRSRQTDYLTDTNYLNRRIIGLPTFQKLWQGDVSGGGTLVAQTGFIYDSPNDSTTYLQAHGAIVRQHDSANYGTGFLYRGNVTRVQRYSVTNGAASSPTETKTGYYTTGSVALAKDALGRQMIFYYDDSFIHYTEANGTLSTPNPPIAPNPATFAYPTKVTDADSYSSTISYNYDFGAVTRTVDPKEFATNGASPTTIGVSTYDSKGRLDKSLIWKQGQKYSQTRYVYSTDHNWMQTWSTVNTLAEETFVTHLLDGASRERITLSDHPGSTGGYRARYVVYDIVGRITERSNPTEINSGWSPSGDEATNGYIPTFQTYDWTHRPLVTTLPKDDVQQSGSNPTLSVSYAGCGCAGGLEVTTADEAGKIQKLIHDVQGRVIKTELRRPDNSLYATTTRSYNPLDQVVSLKLYQGSGDGSSCPAGTCEETITEYDGYGRTWKQRLPKYQSSSLDPNFTASTTPYDLYEYNADDTLWKMTDPRTASVTYSYNNRRQVTGLTYNVPSGVASTPNVTFAYDAVGNRLWMDDGPGRVDYTYDTLNRLITEERRFDEFGAPAEMNYQYNLAGQLTQINDPADAAINYTYDKTGRMKTVTGTAFAGVTQYIGDVSYRAWNAAKQISYDGAQTATMSYTRRMLVQQYGINGVTATYSYRSDGRISAMTGSDAKLNRTFSYDDFGRIGGSVANGGPEPDQFDQSYGYDVFNNFTSRSGRYWNVAGQQTYSATWVNGRMVSALENNTTSLSTEYTKNGQMIRSYNQATQVNKDGIYNYDAAGRVTCEGGACSVSNPVATMFYDGDGRLVKDTRNSNTTYNVRASALGGEILTILNASGQKKQTHVYAGGSLIATQDASASPYLYYWRRDPHNTLSFAGSTSLPQMLDPLGVTVTPATALQIQQYWQNQYTPPGGYGNPNGVGYGPPASITSGTTCKADGGPLPCSMVLGWRNHEWVKEARVINNLAGGVDSRNYPQFIRHELPGTMIGVGISGEDDEDDENDENDGEMEQEVDQYPEVWYEVVWEQQDARVQAGLDNLDKALDLATQALSGNLPCASILAGDGDKNDPQFLGDPLTLLGWLRTNNRIQPGDTGKDIAMVPKFKAGAKSSIILSHQFFSPDVGGLTKKYGISTSYARALVILHELGHATGGYAHGRLSRLFGYKANRENDELNKEIIRKCFGMPLPGNVG